MKLKQRAVQSFVSLALITVFLLAAGCASGKIQAGSTLTLKQPQVEGLRVNYENRVDNSVILIPTINGEPVPSEGGQLRLAYGETRPVLVQNKNMDRVSIGFIVVKKPWYKLWKEETRGSFHVTCARMPKDGRADVVDAIMGGGNYEAFEDGAVGVTCDTTPATNNGLASAN